MPEARIKSKLPIEMVVRADQRHRRSSTNVGAGCSGHPTGAHYHLSPPFLCILSGKRQLHASQG